MQDNVGNKIIFNNGIISKDVLSFNNYSGMNAFYEVIRIMDGIPLFFEDHIERLKGSLASKDLKLDFPERDLNMKICRLVDANGFKNCNVKIIVYSDGHENSLLMYISKSYYPADEVVRQGVKLALMNFERKDPQIKKVNALLREGADNIIKESGSFEVLLVGNDGKIAEGSKSNAFFIKGKDVYTAPAEFILKGITRKYVLEVCSELGYNIIESMISVKELDQIDGLFISGTSIKVLPVSSIEGHLYNSSDNFVINEIRKSFDHLIDRYIASHKV